MKTTYLLGLSISILLSQSAAYAQLECNDPSNAPAEYDENRAWHKKCSQERRMRIEKRREETRKMAAQLERKDAAEEKAKAKAKSDAALAEIRKTMKEVGLSKEDLAKRKEAFERGIAIAMGQEYVGEQRTIMSFSEENPEVVIGELGKEGPQTFFGSPAMADALEKLKTPSAHVQALDDAAEARRIEAAMKEGSKVEAPKKVDYDERMREESYMNEVPSFEVKSAD